MVNLDANTIGLLTDAKCDLTAAMGFTKRVLR